MNPCTVCRAADELAALANRIHSGRRVPTAEETAEYQAAERALAVAQWQAERGGWLRLLSYLTPGGRDMLVKKAHFDVVGSEGNHFRVFARPGTDNVILYTPGPAGERGLKVSCLQPYQYTSRPDTLLTQAVTLVLDENDFMARAFSHLTSTPMSQVQQRGGYYEAWPAGTLPTALVAAYNGTSEPPQ